MVWVNILSDIKGDICMEDTERGLDPTAKSIKKKSALYAKYAGLIFKFKGMMC